ncbi:MAG: methionine--tRNA ligase [Proteobacteria bacterium]|nr:methionine--tRNA ligase [Pseudomonadota bacterium]
MNKNTNKKYLITAALPYVNNIHHIGHMVGSYLRADVYARFCRALGRDVLFVCGADEHGTASEIGALKAGLPVEEYVDKYRVLQENAILSYNFSFDLYGRTHTELHKKLVQSLFTRLDAEGLIEERISRQLYSIDDGIFLADRFVEGTCPKCGNTRARGDQCDSGCGVLLDALELINPRSAVSGSTNIETRETKHLYFRASAMADKLREWIDSRVGWPKIALSIANKWLDEGLRDTPITRDIKWGIPVNKPGYEDKVFYVWFDAPWGYVSISQAARPDAWETWWKNDNCHYTQFMGKDNVAFHAVFFPEQQLAMNDNWKTVDSLSAVNFLNFEGAKMSKSTGNGIFLDEAIKDAPADAWRYALMASAPETDDTDFTIQRFADIVNKDLNGMLGNFVSRVCKLTEKNFGNKVPNGKQFRIEMQERAKIKQTGLPFSDSEKHDNYSITIEKDGVFTALDISTSLKVLTDALEKCEFRKAVAALREMWAAGNEFMTQTEPWTLVKNGDLDRAGAVLNECFQLIDFYARVSAPFIPDAAEKMQAIFQSRRSDSEGGWPEKYERRIADGESFIVPENLFTRLDDDKIAEMVAKYVKK